MAIDVVAAALVAETTVLLALVEVATGAEELLSLTEVETTVVEAIVVFTAAMLVEEALTLLVVTGESHPGPHPKKQKKGSASGTGAALTTATNMAAIGARAATRILKGGELKNKGEVWREED